MRGLEGPCYRRPVKIAVVIPALNQLARTAWLLSLDRGRIAIWYPG